ncbi:TetR/AcrR family transcriptional regulator [Nocardia panacis]|uniref:TetR/AcrR family transcriptional regulator n=1 Tax=Nocardia panacis TaxID=2340916 RepID=UPI001315ABAE|nr:TetR/AcrR family transcriptional regulator [Nocardia panacis]
MAASTPVEGESAWEDKRRRILDGAAAVFSSRGYSKGTTREIAAQLDLSQPSIYHYVGSKADLLREIALQVDRDMTTALRDGLAASADPVAQLRAVITRFTYAVIANNLTFAVYRSEQRWLEPVVAEEVQRHESEFVAAVRAVVERIQARGQLPDAPSSVLTFAILNMVSESHRWYHQEGSLDPAAVADAYCKLIGLP